MKRILFLIVSTFSLFSAKAQDSFDIGMFAGAGFYMGDVSKKFFNNSNFATGALMRLNIANRYAVRANVTKLQLKGSDLEFESLYQQARMQVFSTNVIDFNAQFEFYYLDYSPYDDHYNFTPYISAGLGATHFSTDNNISGYALNIPFGMGFRFRVSKYLSAGAQWEFKKTFTDKLDGLDQASFRGGSLFADKQNTFISDNDWYSYAGVFLTFTLY